MKMMTCLGLVATLTTSCGIFDRKKSDNKDQTDKQTCSDTGTCSADQVVKKVIDPVIKVDVPTPDVHSPVPEIKAHQADVTVYPSAPAFPLLGRGVNEQTGGLLQSCMSGNVSLDGSRGYMTSSLELFASFEQLSQLAVKSEHSAAHSLFLAFDKKELGITFSSESELSTHYNYATVYVLDNKFLDDVVFRIDPRMPNSFKPSCGKEFLSSVVSGGVYIASVKLSFKNKNLQNLFAKDLSFSSLFQALQSNTLMLNAEQKASISVEVSTVQVGGQNAARPSSAFDSVRCNLLNLSACSNLIQELTLYGENVFPLAVADQPATISYGTSAYPY